MYQVESYYPEEFKRNLVQLYLLTGKSPEQLEQNWKVEPGLLLLWKQQFENLCCLIEPSTAEAKPHFAPIPTACNRNESR